MIPDLPLHTLFGGLEITISDLAPSQSYFLDTDKNRLIISEDNMRRLIWALNKDNFDTAIEEVCNFVKERLYFKINRAFNYKIEDVPRLIKK